MPCWGLSVKCTVGRATKAVEAHVMDVDDSEVSCRVESNLSLKILNNHYEKSIFTLYAGQKNSIAWLTKTSQPRTQQRKLG